MDGHTVPGSTHREILERTVAMLPHEARIARSDELEEVMGALAEESRARGSQPAPGFRGRIFLVIHGLQSFRRLRLEDEFVLPGGEGSADPGSQLRQLLVDGPSRGMHVVITCDTYGAVTRFLGRKALAEFGARVLFQMSANDSASLVDNPAASRLGLHRALYFQEREAQMETFRPYALPDLEWLEEAKEALRRRTELVGSTR
jgi:hypothetical protein